MLKNMQCLVIYNWLSVPPMLTFDLWMQERKFMEQQQESFDKAMKRLADQHREKVALLERQFLQQKQQLLRGTSSWSLAYQALSTSLSVQ